MLLLLVVYFEHFKYINDAIAMGSKKGDEKKRSSNRYIEFRMEVYKF